MVPPGQPQWNGPPPDQYPPGPAAPMVRIFASLLEAGFLGKGPLTLDLIQTRGGLDALKSAFAFYVHCCCHQRFHHNKAFCGFVAPHLDDICQSYIYIFFGEFYCRVWVSAEKTSWFLGLCFSAAALLHQCDIIIFSGTETLSRLLPQIQIVCKYGTWRTKIHF